MQSKIFGGIFLTAWSLVCYHGGRVSETQKKDTYTFQRKEANIPAPQSTQLFTKSLTNSTQATDTFDDKLIEAPIRRVNYPNFKILYSTYHKCPLAVHEKVTKEIANGDAPRRPSFFVEESLQPQFRATNDHFIKSKAYNTFNFARGHMAAAGNYSGNKDYKWQTFTYANVVPQNQYNNAGIWNTFERYSRDLVMNGKCQNVQIISGPIYYKNNPYQEKEGKVLDKVFKNESIVLLENGMVAPEKLYKIIKCNTKTGQNYLDSFEFWNKKTFQNQKTLNSFVTSLQSVQNQTGLKFNFAKLNVGKSPLLKSLIQFDNQSFSKTKTFYDEIFYTNMMKNSKSIDDLNSSFMRAKQQKIFVPLDQFKQQTRQLFEKDIKQIQQSYLKSPQQTACQTLDKLLKTNKSLFYLFSLTPDFEKQIKQVEQGPIQQCFSKAHELRSLRWEELSSTLDPKIVNDKKEKNSINNVTYAITKQEQKSLAASAAQSKKIFTYVNEEELKKFIIPVNLAVSEGLKQ